MTSRHEPATLISWSLPRQRDVTPYRSPGCTDVLRGARADVTDLSYMTLMDTSVVKHNMLKKREGKTERKGKRGRRRKQILDEPKETRGYWKLKRAS